MFIMKTYLVPIKNKRDSYIHDNYYIKNIKYKTNLKKKWYTLYVYSKGLLNIIRKIKK